MNAQAGVRGLKFVNDEYGERQRGQQQSNANEHLVSTKCARLPFNKGVEHREALDYPLCRNWSWILKIGRKTDNTIPPTITPMTPIMIGSINAVSDSTVASTCWS